MTIETIALPFSTKEEAISSSILLWKELARTGSHKTHPIILQKFPDLQGNMVSLCPACAYAYAYSKKTGDSKECSYCPIWTGFRRCISSDSPYMKWAPLSEGEEKAQAAQAVLQEIVTLTAQSTAGEQK